MKKHEAEKEKPAIEMTVIFCYFVKSNQILTANNIRSDLNLRISARCVRNRLLENSLLARATSAENVRNKIPELIWFRWR